MSASVVAACDSQRIGAVCVGLNVKVEREYMVMKALKQVVTKPVKRAPDRLKPDGEECRQKTEGAPGKA